MGDFPTSFFTLPGSAIHPGSPAALESDIGIVVQGTLLFGATWPTASLAMFYPTLIEVPVLATQIIVENGSPVSGNVDVGIYNEFGTRLVSIGGAVQTGANALQVFNITDTFLAPGIYYRAIVFDNITAQIIRSSPPVELLRGAGVMQMATAYTLPTTATFAPCTTSCVPAMSLHTVAVA
jgi:hypothetical protein